jgi:hypothetical protein
MFEAQYLFSGASTFSPWMRRSGDSILFTADLLALHGGRLDVRTWHKNSEDPGPGTAVGTTIQLSAAGRQTRRSSDLKELVRYRFTCTQVGGSPQSYDYVLFRMLAPVWLDTVRTTPT